MNIETLIIVVIIFFAGVSIALGIINWMKFSLTSLKISILEEAIEKKTKEFDTLKKERQSIASHSAHGSVGKREAIVEPLQTPFASESVNPPIEVVRSYPTGFKTVALEGMHSPDVLEINEKNITRHEENESANNAIEIVLFSEAKKDTDFASAWKALTSYLSVTRVPRVVINFKNVMFLYDKELSYLEKMQEVVAKANGTVQFMRYHGELLSILSSRPALARILKG
jgi:hypothetical protein